MLSQDNLNFSHYSCGPFKAFISYGAEKNRELYWLTVLQGNSQGESREVFQREFTKLSLALKVINESYGHWDFIDTKEPQQQSGCDSCSNQDKQTASIN